MARSTNKNDRVIVGGYALSGYLIDPGTLSHVYSEEPHAAMTDAVMGTLPGHPSVMCGPLNGIFDNTATSGLHVLHSATTGPHVITVAKGGVAAPIAGSPTFHAQPNQLEYSTTKSGDGYVPATVTMGEWSSAATVTTYDRPWGNLMNPGTARTVLNSSTADHDWGAATTAGGYGVLHVVAGDGTATFTIEHSDTNIDANFDAGGAIITFATTAAATPFAEMKVAATVTTTVNRYLRWQVAFGTANTVTFWMSFVRGI